MGGPIGGGTTSAGGGSTSTLADFQYDESKITWSICTKETNKKGEITYWQVFVDSRYPKYHLAGWCINKCDENKCDKEGIIIEPSPLQLKEKSNIMRPSGGGCFCEKYTGSPGGGSNSWTLTGQSCDCSSTCYVGGSGGKCGFVDDGTYIKGYGVVKDGEIGEY